MIVTTRNSVYRVEESQDDGERIFTLTKIEDLVPGGHPAVRVGDHFVGRRLHCKVGESLVLGDQIKHVHLWRECSNCSSPDPFVTSRVLSIEP